MRITIIAFVGVVLAGCSSADSPVRTTFVGTYRLTGCEVSGGPVAPPCLEYSSGSTHNVADSGRVEFRTDHTLRWVLWSTTDVNPCYLSGTSCHQIAVTRDSTEGTYAVDGNTVLLSLDRGDNPDEVREADVVDWGLQFPTALSVSISATQPHAGRYTP